MKNKFLTLLILSAIISCKENITENLPIDDTTHTPIFEDLKILYPNGGEKLIGLDNDTIRWSNNDLIERTIIYYSLNDGTTWEEI